MTEKLLFSPVDFIGDLRQKRATAPSFPHIDALLAILELVDAVDALERRQHTDLYLHIVELIVSQGRKARILKGCGMRHLPCQRSESHIFPEVTNAPPETAVLHQRDKNTQLPLEDPGRRDLHMPVRGRNSIPRYMMQLPFVFCRQQRVILAFYFLIFR